MSEAAAAELMRQATLDVIPEAELQVRSMTRLRVCAVLRLVAKHGKALRAHGADAFLVQGPHPITWTRSAAFRAHPYAPDGVCYRARHDDSGFSLALFERVQGNVEHLDSVPLLDRRFAHELARCLDRYEVGLTS